MRLWGLVTFVSVPLSYRKPACRGWEDVLFVPCHAIVMSDEPQNFCRRLWFSFFSEQFRTSIAVMKLTYIYWSPNLLRCSYTDILKPVLQSFCRFTGQRIGKECLHRSYSVLICESLFYFSFRFKVVFFQSGYTTHYISTDDNM